MVEFSLEKSFDKDTTTKERRCLQVMQLKCPEFPTTFITHSMYHIRRLYSRFSIQRTFQESVLIINLPSAMKRSSRNRKAICEKFNLQLTIVIDLHVQMLKTGVACTKIESLRLAANSAAWNIVDNRGVRFA